ncbi:thioredoxin TrxC [Magnetospira thiophila]
MPDTYHVVCPHCHTVNRLPTTKSALKGNCGKCGAPLFTGHPVALTGASFNRHLSSDLPLVVDFWADWCGPCKMMAPVFAQAARELEPQFRLAKVDTQAEQSLAAAYQIRSIPTLVIFKGGREVARTSGAMGLSDLLSWVRAHK